jgi:hypothetical protein
VTERVIDLLESVQIHHQERTRLVAALGGRERLKQVLAEERAIRQAGEGVMQRLMLEALGIRLALRDITDECERQDLIAALDLAAFDLHRERGAVLPPTEGLNQPIDPAGIRQPPVGNIRQSLKLLAAIGRDYE